MKLYTKERRIQRQKWYVSKQYRRIRKNQLKKKPLCQKCLENRKITLATICEHTNADTKTFSEFLKTPVQSYCRPCHDLKTYFHDIPSISKKEKTKIQVIDI